MVGVSSPGPKGSLKGKNSSVLFFPSGGGLKKTLKPLGWLSRPALAAPKGSERSEEP